MTDNKKPLPDNWKSIGDLVKQIVEKATKK